MNVFLYIEVNIFAIIILCLIIMDLYNKKVSFTKELKLFLSIIYSNIAILLLDTFMWIFDGKGSAFFRAALLISTLLFFLLQPIICMHWSYYVDYQINHNDKRLKKLIIPFTIPIIINTVLCFISLFYGYFFYINRNNNYHRGQFFLVLPLISFSYIFYSVIYLLKNRRRITNTYFRSFILFTLWPILGAIVQFLFYGFPLIFVTLTISILIVYINIQNQQMNHDYLTGLNNRRQLDFYLQDLGEKNKNKIAGVFVDIDSFKSINDQFGHSVGDEALKYTSDILKRSFPYHSFISRLGGDEFVILFKIKDETELKKAIMRLRKNTTQHNKTNVLPYQLNFSIGADIFDTEAKMTGQEFLNYIDSLMYKEKKNKVTMITDAIQ